MDALIYIDACGAFITLGFSIFTNLLLGPRCFPPSYGNPCRSQSPSTNTRRSDILLRNKRGGGGGGGSGEGKKQHAQYF